MGYFILVVALWTNINQAEVVGCEAPDEQSWRFIACVPSPGECYYSCPAREGYKAEANPEICPIPGADWACYCAEASEE